VRIGFEDKTDRWVAPSLFRPLGELRAEADEGVLAEWMSDVCDHPEAVA
jgi:hypothetical protein